MASLYQHPPRPLPPPSPNTQHIGSAPADEDRLINRSLLDSLDGPLDPLDSYSSHSSDAGAPSRNPHSANNLTNASTPASGSHAASPTLPFRSATLHPHPTVNNNSNNNINSSNNNSNSNTTSQLSQPHHQFNFNHHPDSPPYPFASSLYNSIHVPDTFRDHSNQLDDKFSAFEPAPYRTTTSFTNPRRQLNGNNSSSHYADQPSLYPSVADVFGPPTKQQHQHPAAEHAAAEHLASRMNERDATGNKQPPPSTQASTHFTSGVPPAATFGNGSSLLQPPHNQPGNLPAPSQAPQPPGPPQSQSQLTQAQAQQTLVAAAQYFSVMQNQAQPGLPAPNPVLNGAIGPGQPPFTNQTQQALNPLPGGNMGSTQVATLAQQLASLNLPGAERDRGRDGHNPPQEEISTIFVVGFPPDMQEREFQNMFTFSPGFEAATLKIPNKELGTYGTAAGAPPPGAPNSAALGFMPQIQNAQAQYAGANDPYNLVTVNSGGVVVDAAGSATTTAAWPTGLTNSNPAPAAGVPNGVAGAGEDAFTRSGLAPATAPTDLNHLPGATSRKIIGFAKFRTRSEALEARDVLQGRCVDVEKGAVLKAEMAKKNLHTKRGVGPLGLPLTLMGPGGVVGPETIAGLANLTSLTGIVPTAPVPPTETLTQRERDLGALGAMGLGSATHHARSRERDRDREDEERHKRERERERDLSSVREGRERDRGIDRDRARESDRNKERERDREREAERNLRARMGAAATYDAFRANGASSTATITAGPPHGGLCSPEGLNGLGFQFAPNGNMGPNGSIQSGLNSAGLLQLSSGWPTNTGKPNDGFNGINGKVNGLTTNLPPRPPSSLQHSPPEPQSHPSSGSSVRASLPNDNTLSPRNGTHSLPSHPSLPSRPMSHRSYSPPETQPPFPPQHPGAPPQHAFPVHQAPMPHQHSHPGSHPTSSASSANGSMDGDPSRPAPPMSVGTHHGMTSPQLPSPGSGAGGGNPRDIRANAADQNPPINTLYVGNLPTSPPNTHPANYLEDALLQLFSRCPGYRKLCFRQKSNGPMCFVEFEDVNYATKALNDLYGNTLNGFVKGGIRLSFSKNPLGVRGQNHPSRAENNMGSINSQLFNPALSGLQDNFHAQRQNVPPSSAIIDIGRMRQEPSGADMHMTGTSPPSRFYSPPSAPIASIFGNGPPNNAGVRSLQGGFGRTTYNPPNLSNNGFSPFAVNPAAQAQQHHHVAMLSNGDMSSLTSREHLPHSPNMEAT